jgi:uncharacterized lipoprotein
MLSVKRNLFALPAALMAASLLGGCGFMHSHFGHKGPAYTKSVEERPLEVPPDLDAPNKSGALVVPAAGAASASASTASTAAVSAEGAPAAAPPSAAIAPGVSLGGDGLHVADSAASTWSRVGLALERSNAATILSRDEAGHAYSVETTGQTTTRPGWLKRAITFGHAGNKTTAKVQLTVRVNADGANASKVSVEGADDEASRNAAQSLLATLRQRLS